MYEPATPKNIDEVGILDRKVGIIIKNRSLVEVGCNH